MSAAAFINLFHYWRKGISFCVLSSRVESLDRLVIEVRNGVAIQKTPYPAVVERLDRPGSKARERGALGVSEFKRLARKIWPA